MLKIRLICIGKLKERYLREGCAEYIKRLGAFCKPEIVELDEARLADNASDALIEAALAQEGARILDAIPAGAYPVAMCIEGEMLGSVQLAEMLSQLAVSGVSSVAFLIGGSHGLAQRVKKESRLRLSMSPMTFPHQLSRLMLLEQLYRAFSINSSMKYHK